MKRGKLAAVFFAALIVLGLAASAGAVDGTIEINQAKVMANGGFPYVISASGSYRLTGNLTPPAGTDAIDVAAANVGIDLNEFSITGPGSSSSTPIGISGSAIARATVKNGTVTGFGVGVQLGSVGIVRNVHADANGLAGISVGDNTVVEGCTANNSTASLTSGIHCSAGCAISGNTANGNNGYGIFCNGDGCAISGNTANNNDVGIDCNGNGCAISGNSVSTSASFGIDCNGSGCLISANTAFNNGIGIGASDATTGYGGNVISHTFAEPIIGGTSLGAKNTNLCTKGSVTSAC